MESRHQCNYCDRSYAHKSHLRRHRNDKHKDIEDIFVCQFCKQIVPQKGTARGSHVSNCKMNPNLAGKLQKIAAFQTGRKTSDVVKKKISDSRILYLQNNPDKVPYLLNHSRNESNPEKVFREELERRSIQGWVQKFRNGIYEYDFAFPSIKVDVEIDGGTHNLDHVKEIDKRRDAWSVSQGWKVIRIPAKDIRRNVKEAVDNLLKTFPGHLMVG